MTATSHAVSSGDCDAEDMTNRKDHRKKGGDEEDTRGRKKNDTLGCPTCPNLPRQVGQNAMRGQATGNSGRLPGNWPLQGQAADPVRQPRSLKRRTKRGVPTVALASETDEPDATWAESATLHFRNSARARHATLRFDFGISTPPRSSRCQKTFLSIARASQGLEDA